MTRSRYALTASFKLVSFYHWPLCTAVHFQLVIFNDDLSMQRVQLEGLVAYRSDVKQLYFRDTFSWRVIRVGALFIFRPTSIWFTIFCMWRITGLNWLFFRVDLPVIKPVSMSVYVWAIATFDSIACTSSEAASNLTKQTQFFVILPTKPNRHESYQHQLIEFPHWGSSFNGIPGGPKIEATLHFAECLENYQRHDFCTYQGRCILSVSSHQG